MTILPPKHDCLCGRETCCYQERGHCGRFFPLTNIAFPQPLLFEDFGNLLGFRERLHSPIYRRVAKAATLATSFQSGEGA